MAYAHGNKEIKNTNIESTLKLKVQTFNKKVNPEEHTAL
jgi:hypothetical protein